MKVAHYASLALLFVACSTPAPIEPLNVFQVGDPTRSCSEIEYRWETPAGEERNAFYAISGDFCTFLEDVDSSQEIPIQARCITRDSEGNVTVDSLWVNAVVADKTSEELCTGVARL